VENSLKFIEIDGFEIHYRDVGSGPVLLFGHSYLWDLHMWDELVLALSPSFRCIVPDLPGHGQSSPDESFTLEAHADLMWRFMKTLKVEKFAIVGLSIGAMWGALLAEKYTGQVSHLAVLNSSLTAEPMEKASLYENMLAAVSMEGSMPPAVVDAILPGFFGPAVKEDVKANFRQKLLSLPGENISTIVSVGQAFIKRGDILSTMKKYSSDVCVMAGVEDVYRTLPEAQLIADRFGSEVQLLRAGHISVLEECSSICRALEGFLS
jgi:pimeloyl-ACP methyl ester carboxylesterase